MTPQQNNDAEWYRTLGRIEQGVDDLRALLLRIENANDSYKLVTDDRLTAQSLRIASLESSRTSAKAWVAGALAVWTVLLAFSGYIYQLIMRTRG